MAGFFKPSELISRKQDVSIIPKCGACGLLKTCRSPKMPVSGKGRKRILLVGEAPGKNEDKEGIQFVGDSGRKLSSIMKMYGIDMRKDCHIINALSCRPPKNKIKKEDDKIAYCRPLVFNAIKKYQPEIIILAGKIAIKSVIGHVWKEQINEIDKWVGQHIPSQQLNAWICPIYHPAHILYQKKDRALQLWFHKHIKAISKIQGRPWKKITDYTKQVEVIFDDKKAAKIIRKMIKKGGRAAFDYETNMLKPDNPKRQIVCASICWEGKKTIAFPWMGEVIPAMRKFLKSKIKKIGANNKFEERWSRAVLGIRVRRWYWDTMVNGHILDCRGGVTGLKFQSFVRMGVMSYDDAIKPFLNEKYSNSINKIDQIKDRQLLLYCGLDSLFEYTIFKKQKEQLDESIS